MMDSDDDAFQEPSNTSVRMESIKSSKKRHVQDIPPDGSYENRPPKKRKSENKLNPKKPKQNVGFKCSPHLLHDLFQNLDNDQRHWVQELGFGDILNMPNCRLPKGLTVWLINQFSSKKEAIVLGSRTIKIKKLVKKMLGIPDGPLPVPLPRSQRGRTKVIKPTLEEKEFKDDKAGRGLSSKNTYDTLISNHDPVQFKRAFMLYVLCIYFAPSSGHFINRSYSPIVSNVDLIKDMNWCDHVAEFLIEGIREYGESKAVNVNVHGCVHLLLLIYIDLVKTAIIIVPKGTPRVNYVDSELLELLDYHDLKFATQDGPVYGKLEIDTSIYSEDAKSLNSPSAPTIFSINETNTGSRFTRKSMEADKVYMEGLRNIESHYSEARDLVYEEIFKILRMKINNIDSIRSTAISSLHAKCYSLQTNDYLKSDRGSIFCSGQTSFPANSKPQPPDVPAQTAIFSTPRKLPSAVTTATERHNKDSQNKKVLFASADRLKFTPNTAVITSKSIDLQQNCHQLSTIIVSTKEGNKIIRSAQLVNKSRLFQNLSDIEDPFIVDHPVYDTESESMMNQREDRDHTFMKFEDTSLSTSKPSTVQKFTKGSIDSSYDYLTTKQRCQHEDSGQISSHMSVTITFETHAVDVDNMKDYPAMYTISLGDNNNNDIIENDDILGFDIMSEVTTIAKEASMQASLYADHGNISSNYRAADCYPDESIQQHHTSLIDESIFLKGNGNPSVKPEVQVEDIQNCEESSSIPEFHKFQIQADNIINQFLEVKNIPVHTIESSVTPCFAMKRDSAKSLPHHNFSPPQETHTVLPGTTYITDSPEHTHDIANVLSVRAPITGGEYFAVAGSVHPVVTCIDKYSGKTIEDIEGIEDLKTTSCKIKYGPNLTYTEHVEKSIFWGSIRRDHTDPSRNCGGKTRILIRGIPLTEEEYVHTLRPNGEVDPNFMWICSVAIMLDWGSHSKIILNQSIILMKPHDICDHSKISDELKSLPLQLIDQIYLPLRNNRQWILLIISLSGQQVQIYDSMRTYNTADDPYNELWNIIGSNLQISYSHASSRISPIHDKFKKHYAKIETQNNLNDCGLEVIRLLVCHNGKELIGYGKKPLSSYRKEVSHILLYHRYNDLNPIRDSLIDEEEEQCW